MTSWQGGVNLDYELQNQQTRVVSAFSKAPLKVQRPFYPESDRICHTVLVHTAGGMVGGDRLEILLNFQPRSHALLTTSAAGKAYRSQSHSCFQQIEIRLDAGAICEWMPQETILFEGAQFQQRLRVNLAPEALWLGMDLFRFGRTARKEMFAAGLWRSQTEVWQGDRPLWIDRSILTGESRRHPNTLGSASVMGTLAIVGRSFDPEAIAQIRESCAPSSKAQLGISRLQQGLLCRYLGHSTSEGRVHFLKIWESLRRIYAGCDICIPRVWQI